MKTYIRRKGTSRWLRLKIFDDAGAYFECNYELEGATAEWHYENSDRDSDIYEVTQDKKCIKTVAVTMHLEPRFSASIMND